MIKLVQYRTGDNNRENDPNLLSLAREIGFSRFIVLPREYYKPGLFKGGLIPQILEQDLARHASRNESEIPENFLRAYRRKLNQEETVGA